MRHWREASGGGRWSLIGRRRGVLSAIRRPALNGHLHRDPIIPPTPTQSTPPLSLSISPSLLRPPLSFLAIFHFCIWAGHSVTNQTLESGPRRQTLHANSFGGDKSKVSIRVGGVRIKGPLRRHWGSLNGGKIVAHQISTSWVFCSF